VKPEIVVVPHPEKDLEVGPERPTEQSRRIYICRHIGPVLVYYMSIQTEAIMRVQVKKWGNSASVRIPASIMAAAALSVDQSVEVREEGGRIIIEPIKAPVYDLDQLLDQMTPETFPEDIDFGPSIGQETW
jgi:antitoxin MazE